MNAPLLHQPTARASFSIALVASSLFLSGCEGIRPQAENVMVTPETLREEPSLLKTDSLTTLDVLGTITFKEAEPVGKGAVLMTFQIAGANADPVRALLLTENQALVSEAQNGAYNFYGKISGKFLSHEPLTIEVNTTNGMPSITR